MLKPRKNVRPIRDLKVLDEVLDYLVVGSKLGRRNYTIFQVGKSTLLRVSDVLNLKKSDVYTKTGSVRKNAYIIDRKTKKNNTLYLRPVKEDLEKYYQWLKDYQAAHPKLRVFDTDWLFPSFERPQLPLDPRQYWRIMDKTGDALGIDYLGTHTMRKTGAYLVYEQTDHNIGLVMKLLNHSSEAVTLHYRGLDQEARERILDQVNFGGHH